MVVTFKVACYNEENYDMDWKRGKGDSMGRFTFVKGHHFFSSEYAADQLQEGFVVDEGRILAQVSAEHIEDVMKKYLRKNEGMDIFFFNQTFRRKRN